jgi:hypothetical protein
VQAHDSKEGQQVAIYELTLVRSGREPETRFTDRRPTLGQQIRIDGRLASIVSRHDDPTNEVASERFVCEIFPFADGERRLAY